jgi:hypothetical protein
MQFSTWRALGRHAWQYDMDYDGAQIGSTKSEIHRTF